MGICLSNQIKAEGPLHTGVIYSKDVSGNWTELSNPSSKASSASIPPASTPWSEGVISSRNVSRDGAELSSPSSKASSTSIPQIPRSEGVISSRNVSGDGTELSNTSSKASSTSIPRFLGVRVRSCNTTTCEILQSSNLKSFTFSDLEAATRNFCPDNVLGEGSFSSVFKGWVDKHLLAASKCGLGMVVAVKRLNQEGWQGHKEWLAKINYLGQLRHPNLVKLIGYCLEDCHRLLVYEFMPNGCMENHLLMRGSYFQPLSWNLRMKIALGSARGLAFLHSAETRVIYQDFKTSSILLDSNYNAKISDFGLAKDGPTGDKSHVKTRVKKTHGYAAPEYIATGHLTAESDVYSFGVVLLEILSGKKVIDKNRPSGEHDLVEWAKHYLINKPRMLQILDPCLEGQYLMGQALKAATLAFQCLSAEPKLRRNMDEVVTALEQIQLSNLFTTKHKG